MKLFKLILSVFLLVSLAKASTTVTATITDHPDNQLWTSGSCVVSLYNPTPYITPSAAGTPLTSSQLNPACTINSSGVLSTTVTDSTTISPIGTQWKIIFSPLATSGTQTYQSALTGSSVSLTSALSALAASPRFASGPSAFGYADSEIILTPGLGQTYYNVTTPIQRIYTSSGWTNNGGGGGGGGGGNITAATTPTGCTITGPSCIVGTPAAVITLAAIPQIYADLTLTCHVNFSSSGFADNIIGTFNNDTSAHYTWTQLFAASGTVSTQNSSGLATNMVLGAALGNATSSTYAGSFTAVIADYTTTSFVKTLISQSTRLSDGATNLIQNDDNYWIASAPAAITSISITTGSGENFLAGSSCALVAQ